MREWGLGDLLIGLFVLFIVLSFFSALFPVFTVLAVVAIVVYVVFAIYRLVRARVQAKEKSRYDEQGRRITEASILEIKGADMENSETKAEKK